MTGEQRKFELSVPQILGSALAAVTAAVAASYLGVAGTVIGAAVVSIASTVASAVYTHYLKRTGDRVKQHTLSAWREEQEEGQGLLAAAANATPAAGEQTAAHATRAAGEGTAAHATRAAGEQTAANATRAAGEQTAAHAVRGGGGQGHDTLVMPVVEPAGRGGLPWLKMAVAAALVFAVSMGGILAFQAFDHRTLHERVTGGQTTVKEQQRAPVKDQGHDRQDRDDRPIGPTQSPTPTPTPTPTDTPRTPPPSGTGEPSPSGTPTPTPTDTVEPVPETPGPGEEEQERPDPGEQQSSAPPATTQPDEPPAQQEGR
ncbi:hypothetical protein ACIBK9_37510 [Nonomuraea sp. NPDC050227]|uniref:hypothetical protein n=1 Tax=Nonomuraea sp. NPDC050227 TaxID=3364360 RepID=UPI00378A9F66